MEPTSALSFEPCFQHVPILSILIGFAKPFQPIQKVKKNITFRLKFSLKGQAVAYKLFKPEQGLNVALKSEYSAKQVEIQPTN